MWQYFIERRTRKYVKGYRFLSFARKHKRNSNNDDIQKQEPVEEIIILPEKRDELINKLGKVLQKWNTMKYLNC